MLSLVIKLVMALSIIVFSYVLFESNTDANIRHIELMTQVEERGCKAFVAEYNTCVINRNDILRNLPNLLNGSDTIYSSTPTPGPTATP